MTKWLVWIVVAALTMANFASPARAQLNGGVPSQNLEGLTVVGKGNFGAKPNRLEVELEVSAASEISSDVIVKYRDAKKRLQDAFAALKLANLVVEERALGVDQKGQSFNPYYMDSPPARKGKVEVQLKRKLVVVCSNIRDMDEEALLQLVAKLLDVAQDAGGKLGGQNDFNPYYGRYNNTGSGLVRFVLDDFEALQEQAYEAAIVDARKKAERLAKLGGAELGAVAGVREILVPGEKPQSSGVMIYEMMSQTDEEMPRKRLESSKFHVIPVRVELQVRFEVGGARKTERREGAR